VCLKRSKCSKCAVSKNENCSKCAVSKSENCSKCAVSKSENCSKCAVLKSKNCSKCAVSKSEATQCTVHSAECKGQSVTVGVQGAKQQHWKQQNSAVLPLVHAHKKSPGKSARENPAHPCKPNIQDCIEGNFDRLPLC